MPDDATPAEAADADAAARPPREASLLQFVSGMAMQTLMHLGAMSNPLTGKIEKDLVNAKYSIDLLGILQEKTRGNLAAEEEQYLQAALTELRMRYVKESEGKD